jgi:hypothetical protein
MEFRSYGLYAVRGMKSKSASAILRVMDALEGRLILC